MPKIILVSLVVSSISIVETGGFFLPDIFKSGPCSSSPCKNGATCQNEKDTFVCHCAEGFKGDTCEECRVKTTHGHCCKFPFNYLWKDHYDCTDSPYLGVNFVLGKHGAVWCLDVHGRPGICRPYAEPCFTSPCKNNATCISNQGNFTCNCTDGYYGKTCEEKVNPCESSPCKNGATCEGVEDQFTCKCAEGFKGDTCGEKVDPCESSPCKNGATCEIAEDKFKCKCAEGFEGDTCEEKVGPTMFRGKDICSRCGNGATTCENNTCVCAVGFTGETCQEPGYALHFSRRTSKFQVKIRSIPAMKEITVCLRIQTRMRRPTVYFMAYAFQYKQIFAFMKRVNGLGVNVRGEQRLTGALKIYDGKCHHICFTWKSTSGEYKFYVDGKNVTSGVGLAKGLAITGNGTLVLGQNRPKTRNNAKLSYYGKMDDVNIWNKALPESEILKISKCGGSKAGNVKSWSDFKIKDNSYLKVIQNVCPENC